MTLRECCDWCAYMWTVALEAGNQEAATNYQKLYEMWSERFKESTK